MPCYSPLHAFKGKHSDASKIAITFRRSESWRGVEIDLPCGQCIGCRLERSRQWAIRCMHEASLHEKNCFITLTFSPEYLATRKNEWSLDYHDWRKFMCRLRKRFGTAVS